ncbi:MAG: hypothetical protein ACLFUW_00440 [Bacteroidales bacterium]
MAYKQLSPITISEGGTGATSLTDHGVLVGSGTSPITPLSVASSGTVLIGNSGADPSFSDTPDVTSISFAGGDPLNFYEEGTWTPEIEFGGGSTGITYASQIGVYTRVGNVVYVRCSFQLSDKGSSSGTATIENLPFTVSSAGAFSIGRRSNIIYISGYDHIFGQLITTTTSITLRMDGDNLTTMNLSDSEFNNDTLMSFQAFYFV